MTVLVASTDRYKQGAAFPESLSLRVIQRAIDDSIVPWVDYKSWLSSRASSSFEKNNLQASLAAALLHGQIELALEFCENVFDLMKKEPYDLVSAGLFCGRAWEILEEYQKAAEAYDYAIQSPRFRPRSLLQWNKFRDICAVRRNVCVQEFESRCAEILLGSECDSALFETRTEACQAAYGTDEMPAMTLPIRPPSTRARD